MKHKNFYYIVLAIVVLLAVSLACGSSNEGAAITPAAQEAEQAEAPAADEAELGETEQEEEPKPAFEVFEVGDLIEVKEHTIRLDGVEYQGTILVADYTVENLGGSDVDMSSIMSFSAKKNDGTLLEQEYFDCGTSGLDGKVLPGDRLRGSVCWAGANEEDGIRIYYEADLFSEGAIVWEAIESIAEPLELSDAQLKVDVFRAGDVVQIQDQIISLNNVEIQGNVLKANFTIENQGSTDLEVSSLLSFYARKGDGSPLEQEYFDCGTAFDGSVIPGDKLTGDICWSGAGPGDGIKIYYEADLFGSGAVVWFVE